MPIIRGIFLLLISTFTFTVFAFAQPTISGFTPASGPVGTSVTISGTNFSTTPANNIVFFGAVKATVSAATSTSLTVTVPFGNTYQPITVTVSGLTGYSSKPFIVTFPGGVLTSAAFEFVTSADNVTGLETDDLSITDMDDDGKPDLVVVDKLNGFFAFYKNTSTGSVISFGPRISYQAGSNPRKFVVSDIDGDGRPDVAIMNYDDSNVSVFRNTTAGGVISFAPKINFAVSQNPLGICVADFDADGKPDIATISNTMEGTISILKNTSTIGSISFAPKADFNTSLLLNTITSSDIDNDGKPDIVITSLVFDVFSVLRNTSSTGTISFAPRVDFATASFPDRLTAGDLDGDGKNDVIVSYFNANFSSIYRNTSSGSSIGFAPRTDHIVGAAGDYSTINDLDGDSKPDLAILDILASIALFKNNSVAGSISLSPRVNIPALGFGKISSSDFNADGRPDIAILSGVFRVSIFQNKTTEPQIVSFSPVSSGTGATITITGANFTGATAVNFGGVPASSFTVINSTTITAVVGSGASGAVSVTAPHGTGAKAGYIYYPQPTIVSFTPISGSSGTTVTITGTGFTGATAVSFGGTAATSFTVENPTTITATVASGSSGNVSVTTPGGTGSLAGFTYTGPVITSINPTSGGTGSVITITGSNLLTTFAVVFGGIPATSFTVVNATTITAVVGTGATGNILIATQFGNATFPGFTYIGPVVASFSPMSGNAGTIVTITGNYFTGATAVSFGSTPASSFTVVNPTTITAVVAAGTSGSVSVTTPFGTSTLVGFTYTGPPVFTSFTPNAGGPGTTIVITGAHLNGTTSVSFGGTAAAFFTVISNTTIHAVVGSGTSGNVSFTTPYGNASLGGFTYIPLPKINSFTPGSGPVGTSVTISGENFSTTNNTVYFGSVRATVNSSTATSITVLVPQGANYLPVSVTSNNLTAYSRQPFHVTFGAGGVPFSLSDFATKIDYTSDGSSKRNIAIGDLNNDGWSDLVVGTRDNFRINIFKNQSTVGTVSLAPKLEIATPFGPSSVGIGDFDGDGKLDIATANIFSGNISVLKNTSTPTDISFSSRLDFPAGSEPQDLNITDIDKDGKPDILVANRNNFTISLFRNVSNGGIISFAPKVDIVTLAYHVSTGDVDGDGKPDLVVISGGDRLLFYRNTSEPGSVSFSAPTQIISGLNYDPTFVALGDLDGDTKIDIAIANHTTFAFSILRNTSTTGSFSFATRQDFSAGHNYTWSISLADIDGDGKIDLAFEKPDQNKVAICRNTSLTGTISFETPTQLGTLVWPVWVALSDLDNDNKPDIAVANNDFPLSVSILKNQVNPPIAPTITSFTPLAATTGATVTITGTNFSGASAVTFGGTAAQSFVVNSATSISAVVGTGTTGNVSVTTPGGTASLPGFTYNFPTGVGGNPGNNNTSELLVSPNPSDDRILIKHPSSPRNAQLRFIDLLGREIKIVLPLRNSKETETTVKGLTPGIYRIAWSDGIRILTRTFLVK